MPARDTNSASGNTQDTAVRNYEALYHLFLDNIPVGVFQLGPGPDSPVLSVNQFQAVMLGYTQEAELHTIPVRKLFVNSEDWIQISGELGAKGSVTSREVRLKRRDGSEIWVAFSANTQSLPDGTVTGIVGFAEDITERMVFETEMQYHESELNRYALALTQANKKLNLLSSITRHDISNKVFALLIDIDLAKDLAVESQLRESLERMEKTSNAIQNQIMFTRDYHEIGVETPRWFDVKKTILAAASGLPLKQGTLTVNIDNLRIYADPLLEKVFYNLVENALRHGNGLTHITFSQKTTGDGIVLLCDDDGGGVPWEHKEGIFNRQHFQHTGFGLFLSREILGITSLSIHETGEPGRGARFEIAVPQGYYQLGLEKT